MNKLYLLLFFVFGFSAFGQQKGISYQAVIINPNDIKAPGYNAAAIPLANKAICMSFKVVNSTNQVEYQESQSITTDSYGMINVVIGTGTVGTGLVATLEAVAWNQGNKKLVVAVNIEGVCSSYTEISNQILNYTPFSLYALNSDLKDGSVTDVKIASGINPSKVGLGNVDNTADLNKPMSTATKIYVDSQLTSGTIVDADATTKGKIQLAGDLAGTAAAPMVPGLSLKENTANKSTVVTLGLSNVLFPTQNAVKTYVDTAIASATIASTPIADADATTKGKIKLGGDLAGTADAPAIASNVITTAKVVDSAITDAKIAGVSGSKITGDIAGNATNVTGVVGLTNGGTGATSVSAARTNLGLGSAALNNTDDFEVPLSFASPLVRTVNSIAVPPADATVNGYLKATDFYTFSNKISSTEKAANNGVATLGNDGKIPSSQIPAISFQSVNVVNSQADMIANSAAQSGSITIRTDVNRNFVLSNLPASTLSNWIELSTPTSVTSINGYAGPNVSLTKADIVLGNVDNTSDNNKPISIDTRAALDLKANLASPTFTGTVSGITKTMVGLGLVDNTTDAGKPISTATQGALDLKANTADVTTSFALKEDTANKTVNVTTDGASDVKFPSAKAVKTYADAKVVDGIADAVTTTSPSQNAVYDALQLKENSANKSTAIDLGSTNPSDVLFPSQKAVKTYVDLQSANAGVGDSSITSAKILDGTLVTADLADGSVNTAKLDANAVTTAKITDATITYSKIQNVSDTNKVLGRISTGAGVLEEIATTGSGNVVRATSPTLVTPALGTPTAAVLSNATGLPLTTGVTGTLLIANGGTGQTTKTTAFDALSPMTAAGDIIYGETNGTGTRLAKGNDGQILKLVSGLPSWQTLIGFDKEVSKVNFGANTGYGNQAEFTTAVGPYAGQQDQAINATALGRNAGNTGQGASAVAVGALAGAADQGAETVAVGLRAGETEQGEKSIAIGAFAGQTNQHTNSIILNATGTALNSDNASALYIAPIRSATNTNVLLYNTTTKEITTSANISGNAANVTGTVAIANGGTGATSATAALTNLGAAPITANLNDQTGTTYTLLASDNGKVITLNNAGAITLTVPTGLTAGFNCMIVQKGAGLVTITPTATVTVTNRSGGTKTAGQNAIVTLIALSGTYFISGGDMQ